jgi:uncharacterized protein (DUF433 family)
MGEIRLTGHRIDLSLIVSLYNDGHTAEMLHVEYPTLALALIYTVLAFYLDNRAAVDAYITDVERRIECQRASAPPAPTIEELRSRRRALKPTPS